MSSFEQRLMSEIEFRLERTPVEESDDEVQHDDVPTGKCIAPIFENKLKNFRAMEGVPVTLSCKIMGIPVPKVRDLYLCTPNIAMEFPFNATHIASVIRFIGSRMASRS